ncbi:MAG: ABC transporter ATP-binding protein/permease [Acidobacteria bacterium]|nr:ABC transporter ATP-binding protein/permease [Acidobacteriota bacterium]
MRKSFLTLWPYARRYRGALARGMGALVVKDLLGAAMPLVIGAAVDSLSKGFRLDVLLWLAGGLAIISALKGLFQYWMRVILIGVSRDVEYDLRNDFFDRLIWLSPDFYASHRTGDIMARATNDLNAIRMMAGPGVMYWSETMLTFLLAIVIMMGVDWRLTLLALLPAPLVSLAVVVFGRRIHDRFEKIQAMFSDISNRVQENLSSVRVLRAYVQEQAELEQFERLNRAYIAENVRLARVSALFLPLLQSLIGLTFLIVLWGGGARLLAGDITIGGFVMFNTYMGMLVWPMIAMGWVVNLMQRGKASLQRFSEILEARPTITAPASPRALGAPARGAVEFRSASVEYATGFALRGVDIEIPAGATVAVVGHTGCGKTTLVSLIPRLLDPSEGSVLVDGVDLRECDPGELRRLIGFVPQETFLFSATLGENIAFGAPDATAEQIRWAAEAAGLAGDIAGFPAGYDTLIGERGITLSGGQKQRAAIARAILRNPKILILDDALSSVDTVTEERILTELAGLMKDRTTILISHRVSTVRNADCIFVLDRGVLVERGTHDELLACGGFYADLYQKQLIEEELEAI